MKNCSTKHLFVYVNMAVIFFTAALFGYWYFVDGTIVNIPLVDKTDTMNLRVDKKVYSTGDEIVVYNSFCKYRELSAEITAQLVDGEIISMATKKNNLPIGCYGIDKPFSMVITTIPKIISPGKWHLRWNVVYQVNPIKKITYTRETQDFEILTPVLPIPL